MQLVIDKDGRRVWVDGADGYNALSDNQKSKLDTKPRRRLKNLNASIEQCRRFGSAYQQRILNNKENQNG